MNRGLLSGGMYSALDHVYRETTLPKKTSRVKRLIRLGGVARKKLEPLFTQSFPNVNQVLAEGKTLVAEGRTQVAMPTLNAEETSLLGMDDLELHSVKLRMSTAPAPTAATVRVRTDRGDLLVAVQGDAAKPAILTYHDLGLNYVCFEPFFNYAEMRALLEHFCVYHVTAPGQEDGAPTLPEDYVYPSMDELAHQLNYVLGHFGVRSFVGFGVGAGANVLARFALAHPDKVEALALINCSAGAAGWIEWAYQKMNTRSLRARGMTQPVLDYLMWHHFGRCPEERNPDLAAMYREQLSRHVNPANLALLVEAYTRRGELGISREARTLRAPVLNVTGALSPHVDDTVALNARLNPNNSTWMKISDCAMVLEEQPAKIAEAFRLFLQGEGYVAPLSPTKMTPVRREPRSPRPRRACRHSPAIRITENPISEAVVC